MGFAPTKRWKSRSITRWDAFLNQNQPTDSAEEAVFERDRKPYSPDYAAIAKGYDVEGIKIQKAQDFKPAFEKAIKSNKPFVLDVTMVNNPVPTVGHWNILDIYDPDKKVKAHHVSTDDYVTIK
jgi:acetolactate synthase-1/2/3 large subunit